jgi:uncharacterized protein (DUF58 family)
MMAAIAQRLRAQAATWAERRQGRDAQGVILTRRRIYILPTRFGVGLGALVFAMLLGSLNYDTSLGFALTFLLTGVGLVAMHHCHGNLLGLGLRFAGAPPVFAGQHAQFRIAVHNGARTARYEVGLKLGAALCPPVDLDPGETRILTLPVLTESRGWLALPRCSIVSRHPGNLFRAWSWLHMDVSCLVYPRLAPVSRAFPEPGEQASGDSASVAAGDTDFVGLRTAYAGDPPNRIAWKAYARSDTLLLKQFAGAVHTPSLLDWHSLPGLDTEARLSQLARWCVDLTAAARSFGLILPGCSLDAGGGEAHLHRCLEALALFGQRTAS